MPYVKTYYVSNILSIRTMRNPIKTWWNNLYPYERRDIINGVINTIKYILIIIFVIYLIKKYL